MIMSAKPSSPLFLFFPHFDNILTPYVIYITEQTHGNMVYLFKDARQGEIYYGSFLSP